LFAIAGEFEAVGADREGFIHAVAGPAVAVDWADGAADAAEDGHAVLAREAAQKNPGSARQGRRRFW